VLRAVFDANVLVSALISPDAIPAQLVRRTMTKDRFTLVFSKGITDELRRVFAYPKIRRRVMATDLEIAAWLEGLLLNAVWSDAGVARHAALSDPDDAIYLAAAIGGGAHVVVSGDRHLLALGEFQGVPILTPREFSQLLDAGIVAEPFAAARYDAAAESVNASPAPPPPRRRRAG
jgi:putative PIN family toxin of toxin-antitoxin system